MAEKPSDEEVVEHLKVIRRNLVRDWGENHIDVAALDRAIEAVEDQADQCRQFTAMHKDRDQWQARATEAEDQREQLRNRAQDAERKLALLAGENAELRAALHKAACWLQSVVDSQAHHRGRPDTDLERDFDAILATLRQGEKEPDHDR